MPWIQISWSKQLVREQSSPWWQLGCLRHPADSCGDRREENYPTLKQGTWSFWFTGRPLPLNSGFERAEKWPKGATAAAWDVKARLPTVWAETAFESDASEDWTDRGNWYILRLQHVKFEKSVKVLSETFTCHRAENADPLCLRRTVSRKHFIRGIQKAPNANKAPTVMLPLWDGKHFSDKCGEERVVWLESFCIFT